MGEYCDQANHRIPEVTDSSGTGTGGDASGKPTYTVDQIAQYLYQGFWEDTGRTQRSFDVQSGGQLTVNLSGLNATGKGQHDAVVAGSRPGAGLFSGRYFGAQYGWPYRAAQLAPA